MAVKMIEKQKGMATFIAMALIMGAFVSLFVSGSNIHPGSHPSGAVIQNVGGAIGNATFSTCITSFSKINASIKNTPSHSINHQSHYRRHSPHP